MGANELNSQMKIIDPQTRQQVNDLIYESCLALNAEDWSSYLALCDADAFRYRIVNYSPEIKREQCWMDRDWKGIKSIFDLLPKHNSDHSNLTRHATVYRVLHDAERNEATAITLITVYRTQLDGVNSHFESGQTALFAVGKYEDRIRVGIDEHPAQLLSRTVRLDTRQIDIGTHYPL